MGNFVSSLEKPGPALGFLYHNEMGVLYWGLCLLKMIIGVCDFFLDLFFGYTITKGTREERELARDYENSAQIASIMGRGSYTLVMNHQLHHFSLRPDILFLKHACSILIQSSMCMYVVCGRAKPVLCGPNSKEPNLFHHGETIYRVG